MKHLLLIALFILCASFAVAQQRPASVPDIVERIALALVADGVFMVNRDGTVCDGSRDEKLCGEFNERLMTVLDAEKKSKSTHYEDSRVPQHVTREAVLSGEAEKIEKLLPKVKDKKSREAIAAEVESLKRL